MRVWSSDGVENARDAEIEELRLSGGVDEDVGGLEIAMDDEVAMRVGHGVADEQEEAEPAREIERGRVRVDRLPVDVLHHEIRLAFAGVAGIEEPGDVGMSEGRENLAFAQEAVVERGLGAAIAEELDRNALPEFAIGTVGDIHRPHAATAENAART